MDKAEILAARQSRLLSDIVGQIVALKRTGRTFSGLCPFHKERSPSFNVDDAPGTYKCFGCGAWGDAIDFLMQTQAIRFVDAIAVLSDGRAVSPSQFERAINERGTDEQRRIAHAHGLWMRRTDIAGTIAAEYLHGRSLRVRTHSALGFVTDAYCSHIGAASPALIAPLQDSLGHVTAVQQIFLDPETCDALRDDNGRRLKRTLGAMRDGCVRLGVPMETMGIAGSVEDALSASQMYSLTVWAVCGEARLSTVWIPEEIKSLLIFADGDAAGLREAERAQERHGKIINTEIVEPENGKDFNDMLRSRDKHRRNLNALG